MNYTRQVSIKPERNDYLRFIIPSLIGAFLFLFPVSDGGSTTIPIGILADRLRAAASSYLAHGTTAVFVSAALLTAFFTFGPGWLKERLAGVHTLFATTPTWFILRFLGGIFALMTFLGIGPDWVIGADTGRTAYIDLAGIIFCILGPACLLMPFLTDFGFLEFSGTLMRRFFQGTFNLPGRAAIDTLASWVGASSVAVLMTVRQYESGFYSAREASVITTNFSVVSIPFVVLTARVAGIPELFVHLYAAMVGIGIICAVVTPRIPPLSRLPDTYHEPVGRQIHEAVEENVSSFRWALDQGLYRARNAPAPRRLIGGGLKAVADLFFTMMPAAMTIEFLCLVVYHHTPFFQYLTAPLIPILEILGVPQAGAAAPGIVIGLLDQFVPALIAAGIDDRITSFVLAGLSVTQLIFFAETAVLILRSAIPLNALQLITIFGLRTVIALPILALTAHFVL